MQLTRVFSFLLCVALFFSAPPLPASVALTKGMVFSQNRTWRDGLNDDRRGKTTQTIYDALGRSIGMVFLGSGSDATVTLSSTSYEVGPEKVERRLC